MFATEEIGPNGRVRSNLPDCQPGSGFDSTSGGRNVSCTKMRFSVRAETPSEPTAPTPPGPDPDAKPLRMRSGFWLCAVCGPSTAVTAPVAPTQSASSPEPTHFEP